MSHDPSLCKWSKSQLKRTGKALVDGGPWPSNAPELEDVAVWYDEVKSFVQAYLYLMDWNQLDGLKNEPIITGRVKTDDTLREKLIRNPNFPLPQVQDLAGVRVEADMTLSTQDGMASFITSHFERLGWNVDIKDHRPDGGLGGYRAIHLRLQRPEDGVRVEIQIRTVLQGLWANIYERLADHFGRGIRYGEPAADPNAQPLVDAWQRISLEQVAVIESLEVVDADMSRRILALRASTEDDPIYQQLVEDVQEHRIKLSQNRQSLESHLRETLDELESLESTL